MQVLWKLFSVWWKKDPLRGKSCLLAIVLHLIALYSLQEAPLKPVKKRTTPLAVNTISPYRPAPVLTTVSQIPQKNSASSFTPQGKPSPKKVETKTSDKKKSAAKEKPKSITKPVNKKEEKKAPSLESTVKQKNKNTQRKKTLQDSLQKIEKSITQIESKRDKLAPAQELTIPFQSSAELAFSSSTEDLGYASSLVGYLQDRLQLPDIGEVKMELTLSPDGRIETLRILSSKSDRNKKKLEEVLPSLRLPVPPKDCRVFIITFCNEL